MNPWWDVGDGTSVSIQKDEESFPRNTLFKTEYTQRADVWGVSTTLIRLKAKTINTQMKIEEFAGGPSRCLRSLRQTNLLRAQTALLQQLPPSECEEKFGNFHKFTQTDSRRFDEKAQLLCNICKKKKKEKRRGSPPSLLQRCLWYWGRHLHLIVECGLYM